MPGLFITLEGIDGCGKSTHTRLLGEHLASTGRPVVVTREPGGTRLGEGVRELMLLKSGHEILPLTELFLLAASRSEHVAQVIRPNLAAGTIVLSDRYTDSTVAFQGYGRGLDLEIIDEINRVATGGLVPDLTLICDLPVEAAQSRLGSRQPSSSGALDRMNRFDEADLDFHRRVREGYTRLAEAQAARFRIVDSAGTVEQTQKLLRDIVDALRPPH